jgi:nucleotide-binding universal stress UspA family protein
MYQQILMPSDGGTDAPAMYAVSRQLAERADAPVVVLVVVGTDENPERISAQLRARLEGFKPDRDRILAVTGTSPSAAVIAELDRVPGSLLCMRSSGRSHSEPVLGLVTETVLRSSSGPALLLGPHVDAATWKLQGPMLVCTDGSRTASSIIPIAAQWAIALGFELTVCSVSEPDAPVTGDVTDIALPAHVAHELTRAIGAPVDFDTLHGSDAAEAILRFVDDRHCGIIAAATHGRTGLKRLAMGSTVMSLVHKASVPVLAYRPPAFAQEH